MVVAAIQAPNLNISTQNSMSSHSTSLDSMNLDSLVSPSAHDVSAFQSAVQNVIQQSSSASYANSTFSANSVGGTISKIIDNIQNDKRKVADLAANIGQLGMQGTLDLQESAESLTLGVQFLSKAVTLATKAIDTVVHMQ